MARMEIATYLLFLFSLNFTVFCQPPGGMLKAMSATYKQDPMAASVSKQSAYGNQDGSNKAGQAKGSKDTQSAKGELKTSGAGEDKSAGGAKVDITVELEETRTFTTGKYYEVEYHREESGDGCKESFRVKGKQEPTAVVADTFIPKCEKDGPYRKAYYSDDTILLGNLKQDILIFGQKEDPDKLIVFKDGKCMINIYSSSGADSKPLDEGTCERLKVPLVTLEDECGCPIDLRKQNFVKEAKNNLKAKVKNAIILKPTETKSVDPEVKSDIITDLPDIIKALFTALFEKISSLCFQDKDKGKTDKDKTNKDSKMGKD